MHQTLDPETLLSRVREFNYNAGVQAAALIMSGLLVLAAIELVEIIKAQDDLAIRLSLWLYTTALALVMFRAQLQTMILTSASHPIDGAALMLLGGFVAVVLFVLLPPIAGVAQSWRFWFLGYAALWTLGLAANVGIFVRLPTAELASLFGKELAQLVPLVRTDLASQLTGASAGLGLSIGMLVLVWLASDTHWISYAIFAWTALGITQFVVTYRGLRGQILQFEEIALKAIESRKAATAPEPAAGSEHLV